MNMGALISISGCWRLVLKARLNDIVSVLFAVMMSILKRGTTVEYRVGNSQTAPVTKRLDITSELVHVNAAEGEPRVQKHNPPLFENVSLM